MYSTLIVDDEPNARERIRTLLAQHDAVNVVGECSNGVDALQAIRNQKPQLLLLDIQMPGLDGFGVLSHLTPREVPVTVFITAFDKHALRSFDVGAVDYVLKPIVPERFNTALERALERVRAHTASPMPELPPLERLVVEKRGRMVVVPLAGVAWLEAEGNYVRVHAGDGDFLMRATLTMLESRLDPTRFMRIHRSAIVSLPHVTVLKPGAHGDGVVVMKDGTELQAARTRAGELRRRLR